MDAPMNTYIVGCAWKYKVKYNLNGAVNKPKSLLVAQGFTEVEGIDYHKSFSPIEKWQTIRILVHLAIVNHWHIHKIDINNAFLHG